MTITLTLAALPTDALPKLRDTLLTSARNSSGESARGYYKLAVDVYAEMMRRRMAAIDWRDISVRSARG